VTICLALLAVAGCARQYRAFNPYPDIQRVAVAPFINLSASPAADGRHVAAAYYAELQKVPGFEVVPIGVVETAMLQHGITLSGPGDAQQLAHILGVDCVVVGAISDFTPYYPPRLALQVEWYAADPTAALPTVKLAAGDSLAASSTRAPRRATQAAAATPSADSLEAAQPSLPQLDAAPQAPPLLDEPRPEPPQMLPSEPVAPLLPAPGAPPMFTYTRLFDGADERFTRALDDYIRVRDDARFGGVQGYLQRTDDFIRFACHQAIYELLGRTPGAVETRLVFRRPNRR
jgi:hypothetical protein